MKLTVARLLAPAALALSLAACGEQEETTYEPDAVDLSGGELQMADPEAEGVPVDLPQAEMTNVPLDEQGEPITDEMDDEPAEEGDAAE